MIAPPLLKAGDTIGIVATGRKINRAEVEAATNLFASWQLNVLQSPYLFSDDHSYLAGTDHQRRSAMQAMLDDPAVKAIICARGGYGTTRILDQLDFTEFQKAPKWVTGFSDVTALHLKLFSLGYESIHGTMPILFTKPNAHTSIETLKQALFGPPLSLNAAANKSNKPGQASGYIVGGNLSLINDSLSTASEVDTAGKILVLEEICEFQYRIDRMLMQLKRAGKLDKLAGLVIGHMTDIKDPEGFNEAMEDLILYHTREYDYPIGFSFPTGHEHPNLAWRHGAYVTLTVSPVGATLQHTIAPS